LFSDRAKKEKALKKLRLKAAERNPNEFTRKMIVTKLKASLEYLISI